VQDAVLLYNEQDLRERRRIVEIVFSNSTWKDGRLCPNYRKPFDTLAVANTAYKKKKAASNTKSNLFEKMLLLQDSNLRPGG
jgi:site-specific DNA recombinase